MGGIAIILVLIVLALLAFVAVSTGVLGVGSGAAKRRANEEEPADGTRPVHRRVENDDGAPRSDE